MTDVPIGRALRTEPVEVRCVRASNPSAMTLAGTNTYVLIDGDQSWVVDPGPRLDAHLEAVIETASAGRSLRPMGVVVTHRHADHTEAAGTLRRRLGSLTRSEVPLWAADPAAVPGAMPMPVALEGDNGTVAHVIHTPGHTGDSVSLLVERGRMLTGDTMLGGSSTTIRAPDGSLTELLQSLQVLRAMAIDGRIASLLPGHGEAIEGPTEALAAIEADLAHRRERIEQVREARAQGALTMPRLLRAVYGPDLPPELTEAATANLLATIEHIAREG